MNGNRRETSPLDVGSPQSALRIARERAGLTQEQVATLAGISPAAYWDLELCSDDLTTAVSIRTLARVCQAVAIDLHRLFGVSSCAPEKRITPSRLRKQTIEHLNRTHLSIPALEDKVGFHLSSFLANPDTVWDWNIDCLRSVCEELGVNWIDGLPAPEVNTAPGPATP
jgi:transcriptional regulator with XRE-family HTH domain